MKKQGTKGIPWGVAVYPREGIIPVTKSLRYPRFIKNYFSPFPLPLSLPFPFSIVPAHLDGTLSSPLSPSSTRVSYHFADSLSLFLSLKRERGRGLHTRDGLNCTINCTLRARYATVSSAMDRPWPRYRSSPPSCSNGGSPFLRFSFPWYISSWLMRGIRWFRWFQVIG